MWNETKCVKWTVLGALMPLAIASGVTFSVAQVVRFFGGESIRALESPRLPQCLCVSVVDRRSLVVAIS